MGFRGSVAMTYAAAIIAIYSLMFFYMLSRDDL